MALRLELKPGERIILGDCVITNSAQRTRLLIEGEMPLLREKDIMTSARADSPAKRIYLAVQLMYLTKSPNPQQELYFALVRDMVAEAPSTLPYIENINHQILSGEMYKALKEAGAVGGAILAAAQGVEEALYGSRIAPLHGRIGHARHSFVKIERHAEEPNNAADDDHQPAKVHLAGVIGQFNEDHQ